LTLESQLPSEQQAGTVAAPTRVRVTAHEVAPLDEIAPGPESSRPPDAPSGRRATGWDLLGISLTTLAMLGVRHAATVAIGTPLGESRLFDVAAAASATASLGLLGWLIARDRPRPREVPRLVAAVWTEPPGPWAAGLLGVLLATPVLALYTPVLLGDADSARVIAAVAHVRNHGIGYLVDTQDNLLPQLLLGPVVAVGGLAGAKLFTLVTLQMLAGATAYVSYRISRSMLGAAAATFAILAMPTAVKQSGYVPMYLTMLSLGYLGGWLAYRAMTQPDRWSLAVAAGVCLALAPEAQPVGVLFLATPVLLLVFAPTWRTGLAVSARVYLVVALAMIPRLAINFSDGGLDRIASYRTDYWITEGYVRLIQSNYWHYTGVNEPLGEYLSRLPWRFTHSLDLQGYVVLALAVVAWLGFSGGRGRAFVLVVVGFMVMAVSIKQVPPFPRYYAPLWPGMAILVGVGVGVLARRPGRIARTLALVFVPGLAVLAATTLVEATHAHDTHRAVIDNGPYRGLADAVTDDKGLIGARSHSLLNVTADIPTWGGQFLTEDEYVTYLTWPSDDAVIEVLNRHDIGWVLIYPDRRLETDYHNTWLIPSHGASTRHVERVAASPAFCRTADIGGFELYRLGGCPRSPNDPA
jgi:4-amino-4-deoxy-L-arabinose transferase-like glycosyltransferase